MKEQITYELRQNILDLLYLLHDDSSEVTYDNQQHYLDYLKLLFNEKFTKRIIELRQELGIPKDWYRAKRDDTSEWESWVDTHSEAPKEPTDRLVLKLCAEFEVDPLQFGLFMVDYLYFSAVDFGVQEPVDSYSKEEFRYKTKILVQSGTISNNEKRETQQLSVYFQIFHDTSRTGLEKFFSINEKELRKIQDQLPKYPIARVRGIKIFKRDLEVFLLDALGYTAGQIGNILSGKEKTKMLDNFRKENDTYFSELPSLSSPEKVIDIIGHRNEEEIYSISDSDIGTIISNFKDNLGLE